MKKITFTALFILLLVRFNSSAQQASTTNYEEFGNTLNLGIGIGYYGYINHTAPVLHADYELNVAKDFTLAPFIYYYSYRNYWGDSKFPYKDYYYRTTVIPIGVKGTYYFDDLLDANSKWDFYLGASLGFAIRKTSWENGYYGTDIRRSSSGIYGDGHIGTEYHFNNKLGIFLDLSSGISTLGLAFHL